MFEIFHGVLVPLVAGLVISFCIEQFLHPRPRLRTRHAQAFAIHLGLWLLLFGVGLAIWQRPYFASGLNILGMLLILLVSNTKFATLREPFLFFDFRFFKALLRHPRLYLPFFGVWSAIACAAGFVVLCGIALRVEPSMLSRVGVVSFALCCLISLVAGATMLWIGTRKLLPMTLDPVQDLRTLGLLASFVRYWQEERVNSPQMVVKKLPHFFQSQAKSPNPQHLPHLVAVQCESFFDARRVLNGIHPDVLKHFDALSKAASRAGRLQVSAWGANTVRTEFAFLSGIPADALGIHRFNPYRKLARHGVPTIASELKSLGYRTLCVHPFSATFYDRDKVFPAMGFDEFIDINAFSPDDKCGPYIGDAAVAEKVAQILRDATTPLFIFVITMENHGPLHQERVAVGDESRLYLGAPPIAYEEFTIYLRHLQHTDAMLGAIHEALKATSRPGWLCAYGDHVPILTSVYEAKNFADGRTDYFIVGTDANNRVPAQTDLTPEILALSLLRAAGIRA